MEYTLAQLFEMAVAAEGKAQQFYEGLAQKFAAHPDAVRIWQRMATEEYGHAMALEAIRRDLTEAQLAEPGNIVVLERLQRALSLSVEKVLAQIEDLETAYEISSELETTETNAVFEFLIDNFAADPKARSFLRAQLHMHITGLMRDIPEQFGDAHSRRLIKAQETGLS